MTGANVALLGVSHWHAEMHLDAALHSGAKIAGVWDEDAAIARQFSARHGLKTYAEFDNVLQNRPDVAILMGHPSEVPQRAASIIHAGVPLVLEKPAAPTTAAIAKLRDSAAEHGAFVAVPFPHRFGPAMLRRAELHADMPASSSVHAHFRLINGSPDRYRKNQVSWMLDPKMSGGGALRNLGIHCVDGVLALSSGPVEILHSTVGNFLYDEKVDDYALLVLRNAQGGVFTIEAGYTFATSSVGGDFEWRMYDRETTMIDRGDTAWEASLAQNERRQLTAVPTIHRYRLFFADVMHRMAHDLPPTIGLDDYANAMSLIDEAYVAAGDLN